jgi:hypothetical protein
MLKAKKILRFVLMSGGSEVGIFCKLCGQSYDESYHFCKNIYPKRQMPWSEALNKMKAMRDNNNMPICDMGLELLLGAIYFEKEEVK